MKIMRGYRAQSGLTRSALRLDLPSLPRAVKRAGRKKNKKNNFFPSFLLAASRGELTMQAAFARGYRAQSGLTRSALRLDLPSLRQAAKRASRKENKKNNFFPLFFACKREGWRAKQAGVS